MMKKGRLWQSLTLAALALSLTGCGILATKYPMAPTTANGIHKSTDSGIDSFKKTTNFWGPDLRDESTKRTNWRLGYTRSHTPSTRSVSAYGLQLNLYVPSWRFYEDAFSSNGERLEFTRADSRVFYAGLLLEVYAIQLTRNQLERWAETGIRIQLSGTRGPNSVLNIPDYYIQGFLAKVDRKPAPPLPETDTSEDGDPPPRNGSI